MRFTPAKRFYQTAAILSLLFSFFIPQISSSQDDNQVSEKGLLHKQQALGKLGSRLAEVAARHGKTTNELRRIFSEDETLYIDENDRLLYVEKAPDEIELAASQELAEPQAAPYPYAQTFALHSRPNSSRKIYLDFDGHTIGTDNAWRSRLTSGVAAPFNLDGDPNSFSAAEQDVIQNVWQRMAEDFAPFDVDVTTEDPGAGAVNGSRVVITPTNFMGAGVGGVAYVNAFGGSEMYQPAWVFFNTSNDKNIAEAASHEVGHNFGLSHDGSTTASYYRGHGVWSSIMGVGYYTSISQWSKGEYPGANNLEDDLAIISRSAPYIADDYGSTTAAASALSGTSISVSGLITTGTDVDVFKFTSGGGNVAFNIAPSPRDANLDIKAQILNSSGAVVATSDPSSFSTAYPGGISASFNQTLPAGTYYLAIDGAGSAANDTSAGYTDYASIGQYFITGTLTSGGGGGTPQAPFAVIATNTVSGTTPLTVSFSSTGSYDPDGSIVAYNWNFGDGTTSTAQNPTKVYNSAGSFTAALTVTDNTGLTNSGSVVITVSPPAVASLSGTVLYGNTPVGQLSKFVSGVNVAAAGSSSASTITDANGYYALDNLVSNGTYTVTPSKTGTANGVTALDATLVLRYVASGGTGENAFTLNQQQAADTNATGTVTALDATQILRYASANARTAETGQVGTWKFLSAPRPYNSLSGSATNQNYEAILIGEINGNWSPTGSIAAAEGENAPAEEINFAENNNDFAAKQFVPVMEYVSESTTLQTQISLPANATGQMGTDVSIPIVLTNANTPVDAYTLEVTFDPNVLRARTGPVGVGGTLSGADAAGCQILSNVANGTNRATLRIVAACSRSITASGTLLNLLFTVVGTANTTTGSTTIEFIVRSGSDPLPNFEGSTGTIQLTTVNGTFTVAPPPAGNSATIAGRLLKADGRGVRGAQVRLIFPDGSSKIILGGTFGNYRFANVQTGQSVRIEIFSKQFVFAPQTVNVSGDVTNLNFIAQP